MIEMEITCNAMVVSVALLIARRTNNQNVVGSIPANAVCFIVDR